MPTAEVPTVPHKRCSTLMMSLTAMTFCRHPGSAPCPGPKYQNWWSRNRMKVRNVIKLVSDIFPTISVFCLKRFKRCKNVKTSFSEISIVGRQGFAVTRTDKNEQISKKWTHGVSVFEWPRKEMPSQSRLGHCARFQYGWGPQFISFQDSKEKWPYFKPAGGKTKT